jgi:hypothetical protein
MSVDFGKVDVDNSGEGMDVDRSRRGIVVDAMVFVFKYSCLGTWKKNMFWLFNLINYF